MIPAYHVCHAIRRNGAGFWTITRFRAMPSRRCGQVWKIDNTVYTGESRADCLAQGYKLTRNVRHGRKVIQ